MTGEDGGRLRHLVHQVPPALVLAVLAVGLALIRPGDWRPGLYVVAAAVLLAALCRLLLPTLRVGVLAVRGRFLDTLVLASLGAGLLLLAAVVPRG